MVNEALTESVDVRVVDFGPEEDFRGDEGVLLGEEELQGEESTFVWRVGRSGNLDEEVSSVGLGRLSVDANDGLSGEPLRLLQNSRRNGHLC